MLHLIRLLAIVSLCSVAACVSAERASYEADVKNIRKVGEEWRSLYNAGDYEKIPELYTKDTLVMPRGRPVVVGRDGMRRAVGGLAAGRDVDIQINEKEIVVVGDYGWLVSEFEVAYMTPGAEQADVEYGRSLILFRKDADGEWRVHRDMDSPAPPPSGPLNNLTAEDSRSLPTPGAWTGEDRNVPTKCDQLAASKYVRQRLAPPVARAEIDVPAAIRQCTSDLARLPDDPRIHFHLGRLYGYAGDKEKSRFHRLAAAEAGNHNAIFLLAFLDFVAAKEDSGRCTALSEMKRAAELGNYSAQLTLSAYMLDGRAPLECESMPSRGRLAAYAAEAAKHADGFFESLLATHLSLDTQAKTSP